MSGKKGHQIPAEFVYAGLLDWSRDKLRIELILRSLELKTINQSLGKSWTTETAMKLFTDYIGRIEMSQNVLLSDEKINKLSRCVRSTYLLWKQGVNLKSVLPKPTFFAIVNFIKVKITPFESFVIKQDDSGKSCFLLFRYGNLHSLSVDYIYDYLFSYDEYSLRLYDKSLKG